MTFTTQVAATLSVGDTAYVMGAGRANRVRKGVVKRKTPTGQVTVEFKGAGSVYDTRFGADGNEIGGASSWHKDFLITQERYDATLEAQRKGDRVRHAQAAVQKLGSECWGTNPDIPALLKRIEEIKSMVILIEPQS